MKKIKLTPNECANRWLAFLDDLIADGRARISMSEWYTRLLGEEHTLLSLPLNDLDDAQTSELFANPNCNTIACEAGWANLCPYLREIEGFPCSSTNISFYPNALSLWYKRTFNHRPGFYFPNEFDKNGEINEDATLRMLREHFVAGCKKGMNYTPKPHRGYEP